MVNKILNWKPKLKLSMRGHLNQVLVSMQQNGEISVMSCLEACGSKNKRWRWMWHHAATSSEGAHGTDLESEIPLFEEEVGGNCIWWRSVIIQKECNKLLQLAPQWPPKEANFDIRRCVCRNQDKSNITARQHSVILWLIDQKSIFLDTYWQKWTFVGHIH